jgi:hypothetical protein
MEIEGIFNGQLSFLIERILISKKNKQHNGQKIPKGGNRNPYIEEEQTTQWGNRRNIQRPAVISDREWNKEE